MTAKVPLRRARNRGCETVCVQQRAGAPPKDPGPSTFILRPLHLHVVAPPQSAPGRRALSRGAPSDRAGSKPTGSRSTNYVGSGRGLGSRGWRREFASICFGCRKVTGRVAKACPLPPHDTRNRGKGARYPRGCHPAPRGTTGTTVIPLQTQLLALLRLLPRQPKRVPPFIFVAQSALTDHEHRGGRDSRPTNLF